MLNIDVACVQRNVSFVGLGWRRTAVVLIFVFRFYKTPVWSNKLFLMILFL